MSRAQTSGYQATEIYVTPGHPLENHPNATIVEPTVLDKASYRSKSEGLIAIFAQFPTDIAQIALAGIPLILIAESIEKPGNLGALLRTADGAGCTAVVTTGNGIDVFNPNVVRASTGALFSVSYAHANLGVLVRWLNDNEIELIVAAPKAPTELWNTDMTGALAILVGSEDRGVSDEALNLANRTVAIPMSGASDSLNVSVSAGLLAFEAKRQRANLNA